MPKKVPASPDDPSRVHDCQAYLEAALGLIEQARANGRPEAELEGALLSLARQLLLDRIERERVEQQIAKARRQ